MATLADPVANAQDIADRLKAAAVAHRDAQEVADRAARRWRKLIMEALDAGMRQRDVAQLAGVTRARIHAVIVTESRQP